MQSRAYVSTGKGLVQKRAALERVLVEVEEDHAAAIEVEEEVLFVHLLRRVEVWRTVARLPADARLEEHLDVLAERRVGTRQHVELELGRPVA
jgi:hypothetical protein